MENYRCPGCGERTVSFWQKQLVGVPARTSCSNCGVRLAAPLLKSVLIRSAGMFFPLCGVLFAYLFIPPAISGRFLYSDAGLYASVAIGFLLGCAVVVWATHRFVPLVRKDA